MDAPPVGVKDAPGAVARMQRRVTARAMSTPSRVLFIRPSALGDVCRSVPVVTSMKAAWPDASIDWLVQAEFADAISAHPAVDEPVLFPRRDLRRWYLPSGLARLRTLIWKLRERDYDLVVDGQGLGRSGMLTALSGAPRRVGPADAREFGWLGYTQRVVRSEVHAVDRMLELVKALGIDAVHDGRLHVPTEAVDWWKQRRGELELGNHVAVLAPTARWASKQWPTDRFAALAGHLAQRDMQVVLIGAPHEATQVAAIEGAVNLLPDMTVGRLLAVIEHAVMIVSNDSAALHAAVALDRPCLGLFGPTNPDEVGPWQRPESVLQAPFDGERPHYRDRGLCDRLMRGISVEDVCVRVDAAMELAAC